MSYRLIRLLFVFALMAMAVGIGLIFDGNVGSGLLAAIPGTAVVALMATIFFRNRGAALTEWQIGPVPGQVATDRDRKGGIFGAVYSLLMFFAAGALLFAAWVHGPDSSTGAKVAVLIFAMFFAGIPVVLGLGMLKAGLMWYHGHPAGRLGLRRLAIFPAVPLVLSLFGGLTDADSRGSLVWSLPLTAVTVALFVVTRSTPADRVVEAAAAQEQQAAVNELFEKMAAEQEQRQNPNQQA
ncbi:MULTISPECIES: hypothetical protein [Actinoplanes]|uniref:hypothetical protein n=1 Tax=Actinoplanes TaxID=1865 RepID=UPI0005F285C8|nr:MULTISPECIES: hypothetical protein [Actinoplanes]GLY07402.1 hypothetical protein Acsp01_77810 [Actinoplanes sp. NBRC 101535]